MSWPTGATGTVSMVGALLPMQNGQPYLVQVLGSDTVHMPLFSSKEALDLAAAEGIVKFDHIVQVRDPEAFCAAVPDGIFIGFDFHRSERGTVIYKVLDPKHPEFQRDRDAD